MSFKTKTFPPHLAPLARIATIIGFDLETSALIKDSTGLTTRDQLQQAIGLASAVSLMDIKKPEHVTEVTMTGAKLIEAMRRSRLHKPEFVSQLIEHLVDVGNKLSNNYHVKQNGAGDVAGVQPQAKPGASAHAQ